MVRLRRTAASHFTTLTGSGLSGNTETRQFHEALSFVVCNLIFVVCNLSGGDVKMPDTVVIFVYLILCLGFLGGNNVQY